MKNSERWMDRQEFLDFMETTAPKNLAEKWDNVGFLVDCGQAQFKHVLLALDLCKDVVDEAIELQADLILTHHPIFFESVRQFKIENAEHALVFELIQNNISHFAAHTNLDACAHGTNTTLTKRLGMLDVKALNLDGGVEYGEDAVGIVRVGELPSVMDGETFSQFAKEKLNLEYIRVAGDLSKPIQTLAICSGSGYGYLDLALQYGADAMLSGELKHNVAKNATQMDIVLFDAGHFETEQICMPELKSLIQEHFLIEKCETEFVVSQKEKSPIVLR